MTATGILLDPTVQPQDVDTPPDDEQPVAEPDTTLRDHDARINLVDVRLSAMTEQLDAHGARVDSAGSRLDDVEASGSATTDRLNAAESRLDATDARLEAADARLDTTDTRLEAADARLDATTGGLDATAGAVRSAGEQITTISDRLTSVGGRLDELDERVAALQHHAADHDKALQEISRTIAVEVERHTSDALVDSQHSLQLAVNSIAQLSLAMAESSRDITEDFSAESATALLDSFRIDLDAVLAQLGFESLDTTVGAIFDPHRHRALKRISTADATADKVITRVIRDGYTSTATGRILLFADVEVSRYRP